jgi:S1-C subfamily serine protease
VLVQASNPDGSTSLGSGVIVNRQGQVMTADHVVADTTDIRVTFADGTESAAQVASSEPDRDTAVLQPEQPPSVIVPAVLSGGVKVGDDTYSVGNPLGLVDSLTAGVVSALDRSIEREDGSGPLDGLIQFDAAVNPGSSGGPLLNRAGQVVGIVTALANPSGQRFFVGIGFAVPITGGGGKGGHVPQG